MDDKFHEFNNDLDEWLPGDNATLEEWINFSRVAFPEAPFVAEHLEVDLANRFGRLSRVEMSTKNFFLYLDAYKFAIEYDTFRWNFWQEECP